MIRSIAFQTKARTVDHLGREQIADCPTAISELWKNAYDAYAREVALDLYDGDTPVAVVSDDGHGMNRQEFEERWLVVGTESKATSDKTPATDRNGIDPRPRQGQKGIGRLSCANLGPLLLLISKRRESPFVVALLDWRLFENPFLNLADIQIPVTEFVNKDELSSLLPFLKERLAENVTGGEDAIKKDRLEAAWGAYDALYKDEFRSGVTNKVRAPSEELTLGLSLAAFEERHLQEWPVWNGASEHGTALLVAGINYDLLVELDESLQDASAIAARERFFETLTSFVDPFANPPAELTREERVTFRYSVRAWDGRMSRLIVGTDKQFSRLMLSGIEHEIEGSVDKEGVFTGTVRAFGQQVKEPCIINPPRDLIIPSRADTFVGPFHIYIAAMEFDAMNTTLPVAEFQQFKDLATRYSGFMIFRDGLRVLPFGRSDNDFFEIDSRRSKNAGREFWNHRQMFGGLAITRNSNPNLKDKAGREGLLDNRAAKTLKALMSNVLMVSARKYFGSASDLRQELLPEIRAANEEKRANDARNKLRKRQRQEFRSKLNKITAELPIFYHEIEEFAENLSLESEEDVADAQQQIELFKDSLADLRLPGAPNSLGLLEEKYRSYRESIRAIVSKLAEVSQRVDAELARLNPARPRELLERQIARNAALIHRRVLQWKRSIDSLHTSELERIRDLVADRNKIFHSEALPYLARFDREEITYAEASRLLDQVKEQVDNENFEIFVPYIGALESLKESIDLQHLAVFGMEELKELRTELERLNSLAQLGIAVEIVGHELQSYDDIIGSGLRQLPIEIQTSNAVKEIELGYAGLTDQLRFLSPLRLAGQRIQKWITGAEIADYVEEFFKASLLKNQIQLKATDRFRSLRVFDQQSRLYPVFINLINNSIYWTATMPDSQRQITLDFIENHAVISDSGPGVDSEDIESLFSLFFTKKARGGRGVGLYLSRANLAAGGHSIRYERDTSKMPHKGANFLINFRGAEFSDK